jgi:hypothetical protein
MAVEAAAPHADAREGLVERAAAVPARILLAGIVAASFGFRVLISLAHAVPVYFPDEYIYGTLARSIAESGRPLVRGGAAHFPALLEPLLAAPFWLPGDPALAYRLTQAENALFISLAAVPVFLLARRLGLGKWLSLAAGALAVTSPGLFFTSFVFSDPVAYPLVLSAACAGVYAMAEPTRRAQILFAAFSGLAAFARIQYVIVPVAFLAATLFVEHGSVRRLVTRFRVTVALLTLPACALVVVGPARVLGYYHGVVDQQVQPRALVHWLGVDLMLLAYSAGWVLVPGALLGLWLGLRSSSRAERGFAALTVTLSACVLFEAALYASNGSGRYQERYLIALVPLAAPAFGLWIRHGLPFRKALVLIAASLLALSASVPLVGYTLGLEKQDSPFLLAVFRAEKALGADGGSALVAVLAAALCLISAAVAWRPRLAAALTLGLAGLSGLAVSTAAYSVDLRNAREIRVSHLPVDRQWIDHSGLGDVALVLTPGSSANRALEQAFWNRSVKSFLLLPGAAPADVFGVKQVRVDRAGELLVGGKPVRGPLAVDNYSVTAQLSGATRVARGGAFELWRPAGSARLSLLALGRYDDGWLAAKGQLVVWPDEQGRTRGTLRLRVSLLQGAPAVVLRFRGHGVERNVRLTSGQGRLVAFRIDRRGPWSVRFASDLYTPLYDGRKVSVRAAAPVFRRMR